jgi:hypothetical protein
MSLIVEFHSELVAQMQDALEQTGAIVTYAPPLPNGKQPDLLCILPTGCVQIFEIKTEISASIIEAARDKYRRWCHQLFVVAPLGGFRFLLTETHTTNIPPASSDVGFIELTPEGPNVLRQAAFRAILGSTMLQLQHAVKTRLDRLERLGVQL